MWNKNLNRGFGLTEIVIASALISGSLFALAAMSQLALRVSGENILSLKGVYLAEEALEAARSIRDDGWTTNVVPIILGQTYYPVFSASKWSISATNPGPLDGTHERKIIFEEVWRRVSDDNMVPADSPENKYLDPGTLKLRIIVSWPKPAKNATSSVELINYISNIFLD